MEVSPPIPVRIEWADSQGRVTASWLAAHFSFSAILPTQFSAARTLRQVDAVVTTGGQAATRIELLPDKPFKKGANSGMQLLEVAWRGATLSTPPDFFIS